MKPQSQTSKLICSIEHVRFCYFLLMALCYVQRQTCKFALSDEADSTRRAPRPKRPMQTTSVLRVALLDAHDFALPAANETIACSGPARSWPPSLGGRFCVNSFFPFKDGRFSMYDLERRMLNRWLGYAHTCRVASKSLAEGSACLASADVLVVETPVHGLLRRPWDWWPRPTGPGRGRNGTTSIPLRTLQAGLTLPKQSVTFWAHVAAVVSRGFRGLCLVHYSHPFDATVSQKFLRALARQPNWLQRRTVVACVDSSLPDELRQRLRLNATLLSLPYTTSAWIRATEPAARRREHERPYLVLWAGHRFVQTRGYSLRARNRLWYDLKVHGARCFGRQSNCVVAHRMSPSHFERYMSNASLMLWATEAASLFCLQPPGDALTRSHFYVAVQAGCIPVIFDGTHPSHSLTKQTPWAWREDVQFDALALTVRWPYNGSLVKFLRSIPMRRVQEMQAALTRYANLTMLSDGSFDDAFTMLTCWLRTRRKGVVERSCASLVDINAARQPSRACFRGAFRVSRVRSKSSPAQ